MKKSMKIIENKELRFSHPKETNHRLNSDQTQYLVTLWSPFSHFKETKLKLLIINKLILIFRGLVTHFRGLRLFLDFRDIKFDEITENQAGKSKALMLKRNKPRPLDIICTGRLLQLIHIKQIMSLLNEGCRLLFRGVNKYSLNIILNDS